MGVTVDEVRLDNGAAAVLALDLSVGCAAARRRSARKHSVGEDEIIA
jgi:hypothetical protein